MCYEKRHISEGRRKTRCLRSDGAVRHLQMPLQADVLPVMTMEPARTADKINLDPDNVQQGLAKLVLTIVELLRQLLERQAMRRIEAESLSDEQIERMGRTFMNLQEKVKELREVFGLSEDELNIHLGPLGDLM